MKYQVILPLINFQLQWNLLHHNGSKSSDEVQAIFNDRHKQIMGGIELFNEIKIRSFSNEDISNFNKHNLVLVGFSNHVSTRSFLLEKFVGDEDERNMETATEMRKIVLALQLLKEGRFFGDDIFYFVADGGQFKSMSREGVPFTSNFSGIGYALDFEEIPDIKTLINRVQRTDFEKYKNLKLACKRFQWAYQEYRYEDRFIDYMIAFETLFLKGKKRTYNKAEPIGVACSELLGNNDEEKEEIKKSLLAAYSIRNDIIHGGEYIGDDDPFEILEEIDDHLRASIVRFLAETHDK